jgi:hypothetical protein
MDARQHLADGRPSLGTDVVNTLDLLQGYAAVSGAGVLGEGSSARLLAGRFTLDLGSRRLVARSRFRNTINAFTGVLISWTDASRRTVRAFWALPVRRLPSDPERLLDNEGKADEENGDVRLWGVHAALPWVRRDLTGEVWVLGLHEEDGPARATANRRVVTAGVRFFRDAAPGRWDFEAESVVQLGRSRSSSSASDVTDLDHRAHFQHVQVGYSRRAPRGPRILGQLDLASGDDDPTDSVNGRFDTLYGARRFEYGPTGIYGAFARGNLLSPGLRVEADPREGLGVTLAQRFFWLASARDAWMSVGLRDPGGDSGRYLGRQMEVWLRWDAVSGHVQVEVGGAHLAWGGFARHAPGSRGETSTVYGYAQTALRF